MILMFFFWLLDDEAMNLAWDLVFNGLASEVSCGFTYVFKGLFFILAKI